MGPPGPGRPRGLAAGLAAMLPHRHRGMLAAAGALAIGGAGILAGLILTQRERRHWRPIRDARRDDEPDRVSGSFQDDGPGRVADHAGGGA